MLTVSPERNSIFWRQNNRTASVHAFPGRQPSWVRCLGHLFLANGLFAWYCHMVQKPPCWMAKEYNSLQNKAITTSQARLFFVLDVPVRSLPFSREYFIPCDSFMQRTHSRLFLSFPIQFFDTNNKMQVYIKNNTHTRMRFKTVPPQPRQKNLWIKHSPWYLYWNRDDFWDAD